MMKSSDQIVAELRQNAPLTATEGDMMRYAIMADRAENAPLLDNAINQLTTTIPLGGVDRLMVRDILVKIRNRV